MLTNTTEQQFLLADIGGTNTRVALKAPHTPPAHILAFRNRDFPDLQTLLQRYLEQRGTTTAVSSGALAVAAPVDGDEVHLLNCDWTFSTEKLRQGLAVDNLHVVNDFTAVAYALPVLGESHRDQIGSGVGRPNEVIAVLGPGTGMGVSGLVPWNGSWAPLAGSEGGHATLAAGTDEEAKLFALLRPELGQHISADKLLSGPGIVRIHHGLARLRGKRIPETPGETITANAIEGTDPLAVDALAMFFALLGQFAGNVALMLGARGGVYLAGGILPTMIDVLKQSTFRERFITKGRMQGYLEQIPTYVMVDQYPGLTGLSAWIDEQSLFATPRIVETEV